MERCGRAVYLTFLRLRSIALVERYFAYSDPLLKRFNRRSITKLLKHRFFLLLSVFLSLVSSTGHRVIITFRNLMKIRSELEFRWHRERSRSPASITDDYSRST